MCGVAVRTRQASWLPCLLINPSIRQLKTTAQSQDRETEEGMGGRELTCRANGFSASPVASRTHSLNLALDSSELACEMEMAEPDGSSPNQTTRSLPVSSASEPGPAARLANPLAWASERTDEASD
jgi:hypothetical protein